MEISSTNDSVFRVLTQNATVLVDRAPNAEPVEGDLVELATKFAPRSDQWTNGASGDLISEPGEYEKSSVYIIGIASATKPLAESENAISDIEMIYAIDSDAVRICIIGQMAAVPDRKTTEEIASSYSTACLAVDLERVSVGIAEFAGFVRGLEVKQLIARAPNGEDPKLVALAKELGVDNVPSVKTLTIKPSMGKNLQEKLALTALITR